MFIILGIIVAFIVVNLVAMFAAGVVVITTIFGLFAGLLGWFGICITAKTFDAVGNLVAEEPQIKNYIPTPKVNRTYQLEISEDEAFKMLMA